MNVELEIATIKDRLNSLEDERSTRSAAMDKIWQRQMADDFSNGAADLTTDVHRLHGENIKLRELLAEARRLMLVKVGW